MIRKISLILISIEFIFIRECCGQNEGGCSLVQNFNSGIHLSEDKGLTGQKQGLPGKRGPQGLPGNIGSKGKKVSINAVFSHKHNMRLLHNILLKTML